MIRPSREGEHLLDTIRHRLDDEEPWARLRSVFERRGEREQIARSRLAVPAVDHGVRVVRVFGALHARQALHDGVDLGGHDGVILARPARVSQRDAALAMIGFSPMPLTTPPETREPREAHRIDESALARWLGEHVEGCAGGTANDEPDLAFVHPAAPTP